MRPAVEPRPDPSEEPLNAHLWELQRAGVGIGLRRVCWMPGANAARDGELAGDLVVVYAGRAPDAKRTVTELAFQKSLADLVAPFHRVLAAILQELERRATEQATALAAVAALRQGPGSP